MTRADALALLKNYLDSGDARMDFEYGSDPSKYEVLDILEQLIGQCVVAQLPQQMSVQPLPIARVQLFEGAGGPGHPRPHQVLVAVVGHVHRHQTKRRRGVREGGRRNACAGDGKVHTGENAPECRTGLGQACRVGVTWG